MTTTVYQERPLSQNPKNYTIFLIVFYLWIIIVNPQVRFPILDEIHFERIVMILSWAALFLTGKNVRLKSISALILVFFAWQLTCYAFSPYQDFDVTQHWVNNYWKLIVLYFLILLSINNMNDLFNILAGFVVVLFLYQIHSWYDFLNGGSYVWQQGIKRIVGIWTGGIGSANAFGMITLFALPFGLFWFTSTTKRSIKIFLAFFVLMSMASILFSGTRAAMVGFLLMIVLTLGKKLMNYKIIFLLTAIFAVLVVTLPEDLKHRYFDLTLLGEETEAASVSDKIAINSAQSRKEGLFDGFDLALKRPIFGYGPGASSIARAGIRPSAVMIDNSGKVTYLQLHNLYGQIVSETGFGGAAIFLAIVTTYFAQLYGLKFENVSSGPEAIFFRNFKQTFQISMIIWLFYGFFSHTLYHFNWFLLFGCQGAFMEIAKNNANKIKKPEPKVFKKHL